MSKVKLRPLAVFLAIITIILAMLALLNFVTASADLKLAERYGEVTQIKYGLEKRGAAFLAEADEAAAAGTSPAALDGVAVGDGGGFSHEETEGEYTLTIDFSAENGACRVERWRISKEWREQNLFENILH